MKVTPKQRRKLFQLWLDDPLPYPYCAHVFERCDNLSHEEIFKILDKPQTPQEQIVWDLIYTGSDYAWEGDDWSIWCIYDKDFGSCWYYAEKYDDAEEEDSRGTPLPLDLDDTRIPWQHIYYQMNFDGAGMVHNPAGAKI